MYHAGCEKERTLIEVTLFKYDHAVVMRCPSLLDFNSALFNHFVDAIS